MTCAECDRPLTAEEGAGHDQYDEALPVHLDGGYGMFFDWPLTPEQEAARDPETAMLKVILCHDCGHRLAEAFPRSMGRLLKGGHMAENARRSGYERCPYPTL